MTDRSLIELEVRNSVTWSYSNPRNNNYIYNQFTVLTSSGSMMEKGDKDWIYLTQNRER